MALILFRVQARLNVGAYVFGFGPELFSLSTTLVLIAEVVDVRRSYNFAKIFF